MDRARHLLRSSAIVIALLGLGKLTGLLRARLVSSAFGTGSEFDAFTAANQLPEVFVTLISGGAVPAIEAIAWAPDGGLWMAQSGPAEGMRIWVWRCVWRSRMRCAMT